MGGITQEKGDGHEFQCFPLFSVLLALDNPTVTLLSLDIEGAEFEVFRSLPWDKVDIEVIVTELVHAGKVISNVSFNLDNSSFSGLPRFQARYNQILGIEKLPIYWKSVR